MKDKNVLVGAILALACFSCPGAQKARRDGKWWLSQPDSVRSAFVHGFATCVDDSAKVKWRRGENDDAFLVTQYLKKAGAPLERAVGTVLLETNQRQSPPKVATKKAEDYQPYDGLYWRQLSEGDRIGFIEGRQDCERQIHGLIAAVEARVIADELTEWYGIRDGDVDVKREAIKLKDALQAVRELRSKPMQRR